MRAHVYTHVHEHVCTERPFDAGPLFLGNRKESAVAGGADAAEREPAKVAPAAQRQAAVRARRVTRCGPRVPSRCGCKP